MKKELTIALLKALGQIPDGLLMPERALFTEINIYQPEAATTSELNESMNWAKSKGYVDYMETELAGRKWWLTDKGRVALRGMNL